MILSVFCDSLTTSFLDLYIYKKKLEKTPKLAKGKPAKLDGSRRTGEKTGKAFDER